MGQNPIEVERERTIQNPLKLGGVPLRKNTDKPVTTNYPVSNIVLDLFPIDIQGRFLKGKPLTFGPSAQQPRKPGDGRGPFTFDDAILATGHPRIGLLNRRIREPQRRPWGGPTGGGAPRRDWGAGLEPNPAWSTSDGTASTWTALVRSTRGTWGPDIPARTFADVVQFGVTDEPEPMDEGSLDRDWDQDMWSDEYLGCPELD